MSQPVKLSDALVLDARIAAEVQERSIAGQVEFWARLGRMLESMLTGEQVMALSCSRGKMPLSEALAVVGKPKGRQWVDEALAKKPFPHYKQFDGPSGLLVRIDEDGSETVGRFVNRVFIKHVPESLRQQKSKSAPNKRVNVKARPGLSTAQGKSHKREQAKWA